MTTDEFRKSVELRGAFRALLAQPAMQEALLALRVSIGTDDEEGRDAIASVRTLSRRAGEAAMLDRLLELTEAPEEQPAEELPSFGTDLTQEQLREIEATP